MTDEIHIEDYDPRWPERFAEEAGRVRTLLGRPTAEIEHHGSTSVPGLPAKPVIDMMVAEESIAEAERDAQALVAAGYEEVDARYREWMPERIVLIRRDPSGLRCAHVHLMLRSHFMWRRQIAFRDHLRHHPAVLAEYAALKRSLAERFRDDRHGYMTAKGEFINRITDAALAAAKP